MDNFVDNFGEPGSVTDIGQIEMRAIADLKPLEKNPRHHGEESEPWQLEDAAGSYYEVVAEARRRLLAGEPPMRFFEPSSTRD